ncbi:hypothetical protein THAOC_27945 [Thalassiosira oceanica]|uniref:Uncharacterized protein n=1 Tax=Thalassiosira oceanica TaxID=159749 RepID=K0S1L8_THAOC|nr:hypothetical protein THAOC_27945 [Thalassiosira oceanica]|eukprot:EJK52752.1 hypothetical protein THAOC_27945 [Thalassiosira oceanica]
MEWSQIGRWSIRDHLHPENVPLPDLRPLHLFRRWRLPKSCMHLAIGLLYSFLTTCICVLRTRLTSGFSLTGFSYIDT